MKKIIFGLQTMVMGGVEKELISILRHLDTKEWDITLVLMYIIDQTVVDMIPDYVKVINLNIDKEYYCSDTITACRLRLKKGKIREALTLITKKTLRIGQTGSNVNIIELPSIDGHFDTAVCFHMHSPLMVRYIAEKISACKKIAWIHNDFSTSGYRPDKIINYLSKYDDIIGVSSQITEEFRVLCPQLSSKTKIVYNALDRDEIEAKSEEDNDSDFMKILRNRLFLLTVGRMEEQKGYDTALKTALLLKSKGLSFLWGFIGDGSKMSEIQKQIVEYGLENEILIFGRRDNPYPFMKQCDIYVQPSRHEGYCLTVIEAKLLGKVIVCTDFTGVREQINDGKNGIIVSRDNPEVLANAIISINKNKEKQLLFRSILNSERQSYTGFNNIISNL